MLKEYIQLHRGTSASVAAGVIVARKEGIFTNDEVDMQLSTRKRKHPLPPIDTPSTASTFRIDQLTAHQLTSLVVMVRKWRKHFHQEDVDAEVEQRRLNSERARKAKDKIDIKLNDDMEAKWAHFMLFERDNPETIERRVGELRELSMANSRIVHKDENAKKYLWNQLKLYFFVFGLDRFKIIRSRTDVDEMKKHLLKQLASTDAVPEEPVVSRLQSHTLKILGHPTPQHEAGLAARFAKTKAANKMARIKAGKSLQGTTDGSSADNQPRIRNQRRAARVPPPIIDARVIGKALEFGFRWHASESDSAPVIRHLYGDIEDFELRKEKLSPSSRKTMTRILLFVRWDTRIYADEDEQSREWIEVLPRNYGSSEKDGWEIVEARPREAVEVPMEEEDRSAADESEEENDQDSSSDSTGDGSECDSDDSDSEDSGSD